MPSSREIRARQNRQRRRLAEAAGERQRTVRRRRRVTAIGAVVVLVVVLALAFVFTGGSGDKVDVGGNTTTTVALARCVKRQGELPAGAPDVPVEVGAAPTSLVKKDLEVGTGAEATPGATVTVDYIGVACTTGTIFDSSYASGQPLTRPLGGLIPGWQEGIPGMKVGGRRLLGIPADLAYGSQGAGAAIGPDEPLWFVVDLLAVSAGADTSAP